jgi:hypothetical protein
MNNLGIFINNTNNELKYNINLNNFNKLKNNFSDIIIFDNELNISVDLQKEILKNNNIKIYFLSNNGINDNSDFNFNKIINILKIIKENYEYITVINDNYIYTDSLNEYFDYVFKHKLDFYSYTDSTEMYYHYQLYLFSFKGSYLNDILYFYKTYKDNNILRDFPKIFSNKISFLKVAYIEYNYQQNIYFNEKCIEYLINNKIIKVLNIDYINKIKKINKKIPYITLPEYFDVNIYRNHPDLNSYDNEFLINHFLSHGQYEVRNYKQDNYLLPLYIRNFLLNCDNLIQFFDIPINFSPYNYKEKNNELKNFGEFDLMLHYIEIGRKEGKTY